MRDTDALVWLTAAEMRRKLDAREISAAELTEAHLERIAALDPDLNCFITVMDDVAREQAAEADRRIARHDVAPLTGIPIALKDVLCAGTGRIGASTRTGFALTRVFGGAIAKSIGSRRQP